MRSFSSFLVFFVIISFSASLLVVSCKKDKSGDPSYSDFKQYKPGLFRIKVNNRYGFINKKGEVVIEPRFQYASDFWFGLARFSQWDTNAGNPEIRCGFINEKGTVVIQPDFFPPDYNPSVGDFTADGLAGIPDAAGHWGYINRSGKVVIPFQYNQIQDFHHGFAGVLTPTGYGQIRTNGHSLSSMDFANISTFNEGLAPVDTRDVSTGSLI
ncbi:MAG: WG repeat-containing protein [Bacteroidetes bacterium]|nr:WG repeat-containing protein [Bacteroidota bacterium]